MMEALIVRAREARERAYAPYSQYRVGAALLDDRGQVWIGVNVENVSFGATICAERAAIVAMIAGGGNQVRAIAIATADGGTPCGICLQVLAEFVPRPEDLRIALVGEASMEQTTLAELAPRSFHSASVLRTDGGAGPV